MKIELRDRIIQPKNMCKRKIQKHLENLTVTVKTKYKNKESRLQRRCLMDVDLQNLQTQSSYQQDVTRLDHCLMIHMLLMFGDCSFEQLI